MIYLWIWVVIQQTFYWEKFQNIFMPSQMMSQIYLQAVQTIEYQQIILKFLLAINHIFMKQPLLIGSSQAQNQPKIQKVKYFYKASYVSRLLFSWIAILIQYGNKNEIKQQNLQELKMEDRAELVYENWSAIWNQQKHKQGVQQPLKQSIFKTFKRRLIIGTLLDFLAFTFTIITPVFIYLIAGYLTYQQKTVGLGIMWLVLVTSVRFFRAFFDGHGQYQLTLLGVDLGNTMALAMIKKSLKYSVLCNKKFKMGELVNLLQVDCFRLTLFPKVISSIISTIYILVFSLFFMGFLVQASFLSGFAVIILGGIVNTVFSRSGTKYQKQLVIRTDNRMKCTNQIFNNIKFIKVNSWEEYFYDKLEGLRQLQIKSYKMKFLIQAFSTFTVWLTPKMILVATFGTFVATGGELTSPIAFSFMTLFGYMQFYLQFLPNSISVLTQSVNSIRRIQKFLLTQQINLSCITNNKYDVQQNKDAIIVENGSFYWDKGVEDNEKEVRQNNQYHLKDLDFRIKKGEMVAIIGDIGSGKTSLLYALLGEMKFLSDNKPKIVVNGNISLVTQKPWIINDTVRNNIVFGKEYNRKKYQQVIHYACLQRDFELFTHGDKTVIGEKGSTLSGGQKARISFARALYSQSEILLLDDLLSAVDVHVGKFIMTQSLLKAAKNKTRVLVTHTMSYLKYVDQIFIMETGRIVEQGNYDKIKNGTRYKDIYEAMMKGDKKKRSQSADLLEDLEKQILEQEKVKNLKKGQKKQQESDDSGSVDMQKTMKSTSNLSHIQEKANKQEVQKNAKLPQAVNQLMMAEQTRGQASWNLYRSFATYNGGTLWLCAILFSMFIWLVFSSVENVWLSLWTSSTGQHSNSYYIGVFAGIGVFYALFTCFRALIMAISTPRMSQIIHQSMLTNLLFSSLNQFFDRVPLGRILNRFSKDLNSVDSNLGNLFSNFVVFMFFLLKNIVVTVYCTTFWIVIPISAFLIGILLLKNYYMKPNRQLVRLQGITKSPIISCFTQILNGVSTIRAYGVQNAFFVKNCIKVNENKKVSIAQKAGESWFTMRLTALSFIVNVTALSYVFFTNLSEPAKGSLLLSIVLAYDQITYFLLTNQSNFENELISLERCETFMKLEPEKGYRQYLKNREVSKIRSKERRAMSFKSDWPNKGEIKFIDYKVKYRENLDYVLRGLTVTFEGGRKIGVVGRTGSGKSTIMMCILRILEASQGQIILDGKDISKLSLDDLRSKITIILQDPCLMAGTLKQNLDPLEEHSEETLWKALQMTALKQMMQQRKGLQSEITQNGENLSVGQRQLISIARAILKPTKIVLVDEATANIDIKTESTIYKAMNQAFKNSTVITVAHRLNTVINSDFILVLEGGVLKQYNNPKVLLSNPNSFFTTLYNQFQKQNQQ